MIEAIIKCTCTICEAETSYPDHTHAEMDGWIQIVIQKLWKLDCISSDDPPSRRLEICPACAATLNFADSDARSGFDRTIEAVREMVATRRVAEQISAADVGPAEDVLGKL